MCPDTEKIIVPGDFSVPIDEYHSEQVGYDLKIIALHMDALYANSDNLNIPIMEAIKVVSLMQDGDREKANLRLLQLQRKY